MGESTKDKIAKDAHELAIDILKDGVKKLRKGEAGKSVAKFLRDRADWIENITDRDWPKRKDNG